jgi:hypothetical protein
MKRLLLAFALVVALPAFGAVTLQPLDAAAIPALVKPPAHGTRVVALWALDCAYCEENLSALARIKRAHPDVELVVVATDAITQSDAIRARLDAIGLDGIPARAYADATPDRLNFLIDPNWGGETPRTLVIRADGTRESYSGALDANHLARIATH